MKELYFVTGNDNKFKEVRELLSNKGIELKQLKLWLPEIRGSNEEIAIDAALNAYIYLKKPLIVEDSGLFIKALNGFPGEFSKWAYEKVGLDGVLNLMKDKVDRSAYFKAVVAFTDGKRVETFTGIVEGTISKEKRGQSGFGYDPIFIPKGVERTFAEDPSLKLRISHRTKAFSLFADWYINGR